MLKFTQEILHALRSVANDVEARNMSKSVREQFDFLGVKIVSRREVTYPIFEKNKPADSDELARRVEDMWCVPFREMQYVACDYMFQNRTMLGGQHLAFIKKLIKTRAWRDTADIIATSILGDLVLRLPALRPKIEVWIRDPNIWIRRSAILFQLQYRDRTDWEMLRNFCTICANDEDSYIKSGISKALCKYARVNSTEVRRFVLSTPFPTQTTQEILKNL